MVFLRAVVCSKGRHNNQHEDSEHNDTQHNKYKNATLSGMTQHNDNEHNDTHYNNFKNATLWVMALSITTLDTVVLSVVNKPIMLSVIKLIVAAPSKGLSWFETKFNVKFLQPFSRNVFEISLSRCPEEESNPWSCDCELSLLPLCCRGRVPIPKIDLNCIGNLLQLSS